MEQLARWVNADARLVWRGRYVTTTFLVEVGDTAWLIKVNAGRIASVTRGPFVMPTWTFALRAPSEAWKQFWQADPPPGSHDLFALAKRRVLTIEGNLHPFMANLLYFKDVLASLRAREAQQ